MKKITFTLKQHTPLIHFQYNQEGATLRASEVKPRFDKFITQKLHCNDFEFWKPFLIGNLSVSDKQLEEKTEKEIKAWNEYKKRIEQKLKLKFKNGFHALDYKMRIKGSNNSNKRTVYDDEKAALCMYFGNQGDAEKKYGIIYDEDIILELSSLHPKLIDILEENLPLFLEQTNFGTRQTKGYGSFYIKDKLPSKANYSFSVKGTDLNDIFTSISDFYSVIRAGINNQNLYIKSALFKYLKESKQKQWDKKTIKLAFYTNDLKKQELSDHLSESNEQKEALLYETPDCNTIFKELLGLSTDETWSPRNGGKYKLTRKHLCNNNALSIERFKSPILLKPILETKNNSQYIYRVYIYLSDIPQEMRNQTFEIRWRLEPDRNDTNVVTAPNGVTTSMITSSDFDIKQYFEWIYQKKANLLNILLGAHTTRNAETRFKNIQNLFEHLKKEN